MESITFRYEKDRVFIIKDENILVASLLWQKAEELAHQIRRYARIKTPYPDLDKTHIEPFMFDNDESNLRLHVNGHLLFIFPSYVLNNVYKAFIQAVRMAEEYEKAYQIAFDSGIALRAGSNFALTNNPDLLKECEKEAIHNKKLRLWMPKVKSDYMYGTPAIINESELLEQGDYEKWINIRINRLKSLKGYSKLTLIKGLN